MLKIFSPHHRFQVDYSLVGRRDGLAARQPDQGLWRKEAYRKGYAEGLLSRASRIAQPRIALNAPVAIREEEKRA